MARTWGMAVVRGVSMEPTLRDGDRLLVRYGVPPRSGRVAIVRFPDGQVAVKRIERIDHTGVYVTRDNPRTGRDSWTLGGLALAESEVLAEVRVRVWPRPGSVPVPPPSRHQP